MSPSEINQDPVQGEFFSSAADLPARFVREAIQNSLDARLGAKPVRVRFVFSGESEAISVDVAQRYLDGLKPHIEAVMNAGDALLADADEEAEAVEDALECFDEPMNYLAVEDFGTTGLAGDIRSNREKEVGNHFWGFFRSIGISPKGENAGGSWGLGKWVFPDASIINAYLGITRRHGEEHRPLLMGMAMLKTHRVGSDSDDKYRPYGSFAAHSGEPDEDWLPLPEVEADFIREACEDFGLERNAGSGLSVIVPYPKKELTPASVARAVFTQFFLPVVRGDLVVEIVHPVTGEQVIDADSLTREVSDIVLSERDDESTESLRGVIALAEWGLGLDESAYIRLPADSLRDSLGEPDLNELRRRYEEGDSLAFRFSIGVQRKGGRRVESQFSVYLQRADELAEGHDYFVRGSLRIPHMDYIKRFNARALMLVDGDSELAHLLRDAEGPAHVVWNPNEQRLMERWRRGPRRVRTVRSLCADLLTLLKERPDNEQQRDALADLFPAEPGTRRGPVPSDRAGGGDVPPPRPPRIPAAPTLNVVRVSGGFGVRAASDTSDVIGTTWDLRFAYDVARGNAFAQFNSGIRQGTPDFSLYDGNLQVELAGGSFETVGDNQIRLSVEERGFHIAVSGFDERDLTIDLRLVTEASPQTAEDAA